MKSGDVPTANWTDTIVIRWPANWLPASNRPRAGGPGFPLCNAAVGVALLLAARSDDPACTMVGTIVPALPFLVLQTMLAFGSTGGTAARPLGCRRGFPWVATGLSILGIACTALAMWLRPRL
jgi:hypothetical protein